MKHKYLTALYDCSITELNLPEFGEKLLNSHYVEMTANVEMSI